MVSKENDPRNDPEYQKIKKKIAEARHVRDLAKIALEGNRAERQAAMEELGKKGEKDIERLKLSAGAKNTLLKRLFGR